MRHLFDQYDQPENRLTHALVCALTEDARLLRGFLKWAGRSPRRNRRNLRVVEQNLPGDPELSEAESGERGLPDAWIHDGEDWALLVESKAAARPDAGQIRRHLRTAERRGFRRPSLLLLSTDRPRAGFPRNVIFRNWSDLYRWLRARSSESEWAARAASYFEVAETKWSADGYLKEGYLTMFSGIPFGEGHPYNYGEAKRVLRGALDGLRSRKDLRRQLNIDPAGPGRPHITGKEEGEGVWDLIPLRKARRDPMFIRYPHLTLSIGRRRVLVITILPNGMRTEFRRNLKSLRGEGFSRLFRRLARNLARAVGRSGGIPLVRVLQRRYPRHRSISVRDALLEFDPRTAFTGKRTSGRSPVKWQPQWLEATYRALQQKRSNL